MQYKIRKWVSRKKITLRIDTGFIPSGEPDPTSILVKIYLGDGVDLRAASSGELKPKILGSGVPRVWELQVSMEGNFEPGNYQIIISRVDLKPVASEIYSFRID